MQANDRTIAILEEAARLLYREWFVNLRFPGWHQARRQNNLPVGWCKAPVSALVETNPKVVFDRHRSCPFVPMQSLSETSMVIYGVEERIIQGGAKFENFDTLLARITPCLENGKTGFVQFLTDDAPVASGSTEFIVLRSKLVSPYWVYCIARDDAFRKHVIASMAGSDGRQRVNTKCFDSYFALQPPQEILDAFDEIVRPMFAQINNLAKMNQRLKACRDALLPKLMSGEFSI